MPYTPRPACLRLGVDYWKTSGQVQWGTNTPQHFSALNLTRIRGWSHQAAALLSRPIIASIGRWTTFREWEAQHAPVAAAAPPPPQASQTHLTSAPLTTCQTAPGCAFFLKQGSVGFAHAVRRARLLCNRAYTQHTRSRFAKADAVITPECTNAACAAASSDGMAPEESVQHALLHCLRYSVARQVLATQLQSIGIQQLSLSSILCASMPPDIAPADQSRLLTCTDAFLDAVDTARKAAIGLLPLDAG
jgi:hypothetical protein